MSRSPVSFKMLGALATGVVLTGCGGSQPPIGAPGAMPQSRAMAQRFQHPTLSLARATSTDGTFPMTRLVPINGKLYGTTSYGGAYCPTRSRGGCGTVFSITTRGTEKVLHSFGNGSDGILSVKYDLRRRLALWYHLKSAALTAMASDLKPYNERRGTRVAQFR